MTDIVSLGWGPDLAESLAQLSGDGTRLPARVFTQRRDRYVVVSSQGEHTAQVSGRLRHQAADRRAFPTVGDWVVIEPAATDGPATIHSVLPRRSLFSRRAAGPEDVEQLIAANIDTLFLVTGLDGNFSVRRVERYVTQAWDSGASPVVLLNKSDLCDEVEDRVAEVEGAVIGVPVHALSAEHGEGLEPVLQHLRPGTTAALVGSSGVGKSTLLNRLAGAERMEVKHVRAGDSRGRHTTSHRELIPLPCGALMIDTPGMRELQVWGEDDGALREAYDDVESLAAECRFPDCAHRREPGCAVRGAIEGGQLDPQRLANYLRMEREFARLARRQQQQVVRQENDQKRRDRRRGRRADRRRLLQGAED